MPRPPHVDVGSRDPVKILDEIEADPKVKVIVFDSAVPDYLMAHYDLLKPLKDSTGMKPGPTNIHPVPDDFMVRLGADHEDPTGATCSTPCHAAARNTATPLGNTEHHRPEAIGEQS
jgi:hypothetical protein